jgi:indole-3-glycerol phosphate synthase
MSRLAEIIAYKKTEIEPWLAHTDEWRDRVLSHRPHYRGFIEQFGRNGFGFIAEIKRASPSAGIIVEDFDPAAVAGHYEAAGADCISVLTDERYFHGHLDYLALVRRHATRPLLRKDFTLHEVQVYQAALAGADAVLLIVAALTENTLRHLLNVSREIGIDCLVEVHDRPELEQALAAEATFVGINNRNLATFETDLKTTERLCPLIPEHCTVVSESGIKDEADVRRIAESGVDGVLVGEALMRSRAPQELLQRLRTAALAAQ